MSIEDERGVTYRNTQIREDDGWRLTESEVDFCDENDMYVNTFRVETHPVQASLSGTAWSPDGFETYWKDLKAPKRRKHFD